MAGLDLGIEHDVAENCASCRFAKQVVLTGDYMCEKRGLVKPDFVCKKYSYNVFLKHPPRRRGIDTSKYSPDDFSIE